MLLNVICPNGVREGQPITITHPVSKQQLQVMVPAGIVPGMQFQVQLPDTASPPIAVGVPAGPYGGAPRGYAPPSYGQPQGQPGYGGAPVYGGAPPSYSYPPSAPQAHGGGYGQPPPDIRSNKHAWFDYFDRDRSGGIDRRELVAAIIETFGVQDPSKRADIASAVEACWGMMDFDANGTVSREEFLRPDGLADTIIANVHYP
jgi:hypothetical protein